MFHFYLYLFYNNNIFFLIPFLDFQGGMYFTGWIQRPTEEDCLKFKQQESRMLHKWWYRT